MLMEENINVPPLLGLQFRDENLLITALTHRSYLHEHPSEGGQTNERLEFLGDAVLQMIVTAELYRRHPGLAEGQLSKLRGFVVNEEMLGDMALHLRLHEHLRLGRGEARGAETRRSLMADALEALLGAIYLDQGYAAAANTWWMWVGLYGKDLLDPSHLDEYDAKSRLQEYCLKNWRELPIYTASEFRKGDQGAYRVTLEIRHKALLCVEDVSKKKAEAWLARACLHNHLHLTLQKG